MWTNKDLLKKSLVIFLGFLKMIKLLVIHAEIYFFKNCKYEILNHLYFGANFVFWG